MRGAKRPRPLQGRILVAAVSIAYIATVLIGCADPASENQPGSPPNLVLVSIDTLRADHLGCYGYDRPTSPAIDALAARGARFDRAIANSPWTIPSHVSMFTGLYPRSHGVKSHKTGMREETPIVSELLQAAGYDTAAFVGTSYLSGRYGFNRGFSTFRIFPARLDNHRVRVGDRQLGEVNAWVSGDRVEPFFLFVHLYDVHSDYDPSQESLDRFAAPYEGTLTGTTEELRAFREGELELSEADVRHLVDRYDAGLRELDDELAGLLGLLDSSGLAERSIVMLTSDHGEEFLEHGGVMHGRTLYDELLSVPLIVSGPGVPSGKEIGAVVQLSDVAPTLLALAGIEAPEPMDGSDISGYWTGALKASGALADDGDGDRDETGHARLAYAEADHNNEEDDVLRMVRRGRFKLVLDRRDGSRRLFDLETDPGETRDVAPVHAEAAGALADALETYMTSGDAAGVPLPQLTKEEREMLKSLGYLN